MVLSAPRLTMRAVLLAVAVVVVATWSVVTIAAAVRGEAIPLDQWLIPAAAVAAIVRLLPGGGRRPPDDREEG